jgi:hypothetical protein
VNWEQLKPGDAVGVRRGRWSASPNYERGVVARVMIQQIALEDGRKFRRKDGREASGGVLDLVPIETVEAAT